MMSLVSVSISLCISLFFAPTLGESSSCQCGGKYANGQAVTGCANDRCSADAATNTRCVTIYLEKRPIGNGCIPWPAHVSDCASFDDGSRICADDVCTSALLSENEGECALAGGDVHGMAVATALNKKGFAFFLDYVKYQVGLFVDALVIADMTMQVPIPAVGEINLTVTDVKIQKFLSPSFSYELVPPASVKILAKGGDFDVTAKWDVKKGFIHAGGDIQVGSKDHKGVDVAATVEITVNEKGQIRMRSTDCDVDVPVDVVFSKSSLGAMANTLPTVVGNLAKSQIAAYVCWMVETSANGTVPAILDALPTQYEIYDPLGLAYTFRSITITDNTLVALLGANSTSTVAFS